MLTKSKKDQIAEISSIPAVKLPARRKFSFRLDKIGIRTHMVLIILLIFTPLLAIEVYSSVREYQTQRQEVLNNQAATARSVAQTFTAFINDQINNNKALGIAWRDSLLNGKLPDQQDGNNLLAEYRSLLPLLKSYRILDRDGITRYADPALLVGIDMSSEPGYKEIMNGKDTFLSNLRQSQTDNTTPVITIFTGIRNSDNQLVGIITASIDTTRLNGVLDFTVGSKQRGSISIHDTAANLIYNSASPQLPYASRINRSSETVKVALGGKEALIDYVKSGIDGLEKMGASVPIKQFGWSASVAEPIDDAMSATLDNIRPRLVYFGLVAVLAVVLAWIYSRFISRPLVDLKRAVQSFGQGDLEARVGNPKYAASEIQELSQGFNNMAGQISNEARARDSFLAQASHELKTPLTVIKGTTQILSRKWDKLREVPATTETTARAGRGVQGQGREFNNIELQVNRMTELINRLLDLNRIQSGQMQYHFEATNLFKLIEHSIEAATFLSSPEKHPITLNIADMPEDAASGLVELDTPRIEQVLLNLLENAVKYSPRGGPITVTVNYSPAGANLAVPGITISIQDNGMGVPPDALEHLFERYYRVEQSAGEVTGLGLGLYISWQISKHHNGKLWATSSGPGQGSTFYLVLPLKQPQKTLSAEALISSI